MGDESDRQAVNENEAPAPPQDDDSDDDIGPMPPTAAEKQQAQEAAKAAAENGAESTQPPPKKKRKRLQFEEMYLRNLPKGKCYERSFMHRETITHTIATRCA